MRHTLFKGGQTRAPPQALAHAKAKGQVREPASRALAVQPALGVIALVSPSNEYSGLISFRMD